MEKFVDIFSKKYNLNSKDAASLLALMEPVTYRRGEMLVREGELNTSFHLIGQGIWRGYYLRNGVDVSIWFATTGESLFSTRGYMGGRPSGTSIEAMSDSLLYRIGRQELEAFFAALPALTRPLVVVSEEAGLGLVPADPLSRRFRDILGRSNQRLAACANRVQLVSCGLALRLK